MKENKNALLSLAAFFISAVCNIMLFGIFYTTRTEDIAADSSFTTFVISMGILMVVTFVTAIVFLVKEKRSKEKFNPSLRVIRICFILVNLLYIHFNLVVITEVIYMAT